jgi:hypothetical protein
MLSKSAGTFFKNQQVNQKFAALVTAHQRSFAGGGPKKPAMPAGETNFDVVFVGNYRFLIILRWTERNFIVKVCAM